MENIIDVLVKAGYFRARISTLSDFDKIIGGMAWAMQVFSYDININIFYTDTLDLGQKIALTERLVMVCLVMSCPHQIEPHQIVGLDYANILPLLKWLVKRSAEIRQEHEAFNRLLALRHYHRVTNSIQSRNNKSYYIIPMKHVKKLRTSSIDDENVRNSENFKEIKATAELLNKLDHQFKDNKQVSFVKLPNLFRAVNRNQSALARQPEEEVDEVSGAEETVSLKESTKEESCVNEVAPREEECSSAGDSIEVHRELDAELLATNQKILNLLKRLDSMPSPLEIDQYQRRYIELHQQLISKNRDLKKLYALFNSLDSTKHYLTKEINLLDSILSNLDLISGSSSNRSQFMRQFHEIVEKIQNVRDEVVAKLMIIRRKCDSLNAEHAALLNKQSRE